MVRRAGFTQSDTGIYTANADFDHDLFMAAYVSYQQHH